MQANFQHHGLTLKSPELEHMIQLVKENFASIRQEIGEEYASNPRIRTQIGNRPKPQHLASWVAKEIMMPRAKVSSGVSDKNLDAFSRI